MENEKNIFVSLEALAAGLCLPKAYLKELALKGSIPCLNVNGRLRFNIIAVQQALDKLASKGGHNAS
jgi:hypothetical protein